MEKNQFGLAQTSWILGGVLAVGLGLRLWGLGFGLPYLYHHDEGPLVVSALRMVHTGDLKPDFFIWPSVLVYLNALAYYGFYIVGFLRGVFTTPADLPPIDFQTVSVGKIAYPELILLGRGLSAIGGTLSIFLIYLICRQIHLSRPWALFGALWVAVEPIGVRNSHFIRPDTIAIFFTLAALYFALRILDQPGAQNSLLAGIAAGLAISTKYNLALIVLPIALALFIKYRARALLHREIYIAGFATIIAFLLTSPYILLEWNRFWHTGLIQNARVYAVVGGGRPSPIGAYFELLWSDLGIALICALIGTVLILRRRDKKGILVQSFVFSYLIFINLFTVHFDNTILPAIPLIGVLGAAGLAGVHEFWQTHWFAPRAIGSLTFGALAILSTFSLFTRAVADDQYFTKTDEREAARQWIEANLAPGSRIALEPFSPYLDRSKFVVVGFSNITEHDADWYASNGFEYMVFRGAYGRAFNDYVRSAKVRDAYTAFFERLTPIAQFADGDWQVRVYKTNAQLPPHRVAARFGDYGDVIELVGYEASDWQAGAPLHLKLYWRVLASKPEPLELLARLVGEDGQPVASVQRDLYAGKTRALGVFAVDWTMPDTPRIAPGTYRLQLNVIQTRFDHLPPALTGANDKFDKVELGPFVTD